MPHDGHHHDHHHDPEAPPDLSLYEKRVDALYQLLQQPGRGAATGAIRAGQECLKDVDWNRVDWHDRWIEEMRDRLVETGVLSTAEIEARLARLKTENPA